MFKVKQTKGELKILLCAIVVFWAYREKGYYSLWKIASAIRLYVQEQKALQADILAAEKWGIPVGTLMCAIDKGKLPVDDMFPAKMQEIRSRSGCIAYFGKFGVLPCAQGKKSGAAVIKEAWRWAFDHKVETAVMLMHPMHVPFYLRIGFREVARSNSSPEGMQEAPTVLMLWDKVIYKGK